MKILIRGTNWIGDAIMTIPAMREVRRIFPLAHIALWTRPWAEGIFRNAGFIDEIISLEDRGKNFKQAMRQAALIRNMGFDLGIVFPNSYRSAAQTKLGKVKRRFGYAGEGRRFLLTDPIRVPKWKNNRHEVFYYLHLIEEVEQRLLGGTSVKESTPDISLNISDERMEEAREMLEKAGCLPGRPIIALGPGSTNSRAKRWPAERFAELAEKLGKDTGANIVMLGSKEESETASHINEMCDTPLIDLTGKTDLGQASAILSLSDIFISNDMGLAHLADSVGTKTFVIFGPTNPVTTRPFSETAEVVREPVECSPCMLRDCPIDHRCMARISVDRVFKLTLAHLSGLKGSK